MNLKGVIDMKKYNGFDIVKYIMAIFVIAIHTYPINKDNHYVLNIITQSAVPFFS